VKFLVSVYDYLYSNTLIVTGWGYGENLAVMSALPHSSLNIAVVGSLLVF